MLVNSHKLEMMHDVVGLQRLQEMVEEIKASFQSLSSRYADMKSGEMHYWIRKLQEESSLLGTDGIYREVLLAKRAIEEGNDPKPYLKAIIGIIDTSMRLLDEAIQRLATGAAMPPAGHAR